MASANLGKTNDNFKAQFLAEINSMVKNIYNPNFTILGSKGASISFYVNNDGYIAKSEGLLDLILGNTQSGEYTIGFTTDIYGINNTTVVKPVISSSNSFSLLQLKKETETPIVSPVPNKKVFLNDKIVKYKKIEYISLKDVKLNKSIGISVDKRSKYIVSYNNKSIRITPYKVSYDVYVKGKKHKAIRVYLPLNTIKSLGLSVIDKNIYVAEKLIYKKIQYIKIEDVKMNKSIYVHSNKSLKYVVNFDKKSIIISPYRVTKNVYIDGKKHKIVSVYLPSNSLKNLGLSIKNI